MLEQNDVCFYCERKFNSTKLHISAGIKTIDHIVPRCKGGKNIERNCVVSCNWCNGAKGDRLLEQFHEHLDKLRMELPYNVLKIIDIDLIQFKVRHLLFLIKHYSKYLYVDLPTPYWLSNNPDIEVKKVVPELHATPKVIPPSFDKNGSKDYAHCIGTLNKNIGYGFGIGKEVYYDQFKDIYILDYVGTKISYNIATIQRFINYNGVTPNGTAYDKTISLSQFKNRLKSEVHHNNFHIAEQ